MLASFKGCSEVNIYVMIVIRVVPASHPRAAGHVCAFRSKLITESGRT
jgi:hypothetical protein